MPENLPELLTVAEVATLLRINQMTVSTWIEGGTFPHIRLGRRIRIRREDCLAFAGAQGDPHRDEPMTIEL